MRQRRTPLFALLTAGALSLSACTVTAAEGETRSSSSSRVTPVTAAPATAAAVYQQMRESVTAAKSVQIKGVYIDKGQETQLDVAGDRAGMTMRLLVNFGAGLIEVLRSTVISISRLTRGTGRGWQAPRRQPDRPQGNTSRSPLGQQPAWATSGWARCSTRSSQKIYRPRTS